MTLRAMVFLLLAASSCGRRPDVVPGPPDVYSLSGEVVRVDVGKKKATIRHGPVKDAAGKLWMEGMTMEFPIRYPKDLALLHPGLKIKAKLFQQPVDFEYWVAEVEVAH